MPRTSSWGSTGRPRLATLGSMTPLARGAFSEVFPAPWRPGHDTPLVVERTHLSLSEQAGLLDLLEEEARRMAGLGPPFRHLFRVTRSPTSVSFLAEHFIGLSGKALVRALGAERRLLPLPAWLALAEVLTRTPALVGFGPAAGGGLDTFGFDVRCRVVLFPEPHLALSGAHLEHLLPPAPRVGRGMADIIPYASPELLTGMPLTPAAGVFSLATALIELLTVSSPFLRTSAAETSRAVLRGEPPWRSDVHPECPPALGDVLTRALHPDPAKRWPSLSAFGAALLVAAGVPPVSVEEATRVALGLDIPLVQRQLRALAEVPEWLPERWRGGGLEIFEDALLERLGRPSDLPSRDDRGPGRS